MESVETVLLDGSSESDEMMDGKSTLLEIALRTFAAHTKTHSHYARSVPRDM